MKNNLKLLNAQLLKVTFVLEVFSEMFPQKSFILIATLPLVKGQLVLHVVGAILDLLEDGKWHSLTEIADKSGLHEFKLEIATNFLAEYDFVELDKVNQKVKLVVSVADFLKKIKHIEKDERAKTA